MNFSFGTEHSHRFRQSTQQISKCYREHHGETIVLCKLHTCTSHFHCIAQRKTSLLCLLTVFLHTVLTIFPQEGKSVSFSLNKQVTWGAGTLKHTCESEEEVRGSRVRSGIFTSPILHLCTRYATVFALKCEINASHHALLFNFFYLFSLNRVCSSTLTLPHLFPSHFHLWSSDQPHVPAGRSQTHHS